MSGTVRVSSRREVGVGRLVRALRSGGLEQVTVYVREVRRRGGLPVAHAVPLAVLLTAVITWALVVAASAAGPT
jgi:hypothetical protein